MPIALISRLWIFFNFGYVAVDMLILHMNNEKVQEKLWKEPKEPEGALDRRIFGPCFPHVRVAFSKWDKLSLSEIWDESPLGTNCRISEQNFSAIDVDLMIFEPCFLFPYLAAALSGRGQGLNVQMFIACADESHCENRQF